MTDLFLAGTDTGTYAYLVPGYALQEEIRIFEDLGMSPRELPEAKLDGAWYSLDHRLRERRKLLILEKRMHEQPRTMGDYKE